MATQVWKVYAVAMSVAVASFYLCPTSGVGPAVWQVAIGWCGALGMMAGVRLHRTRAAGACYLFAAGVFMNSSGIAVEAYLSRGGRPFAPPSLADVCYLSLYPGLVAGMVWLIVQRSSRREWASLVDAATIATGLGLLMWVFLVRPSIGDPRWSPIGQLVVVAYPIGDIAVLALLLRLMMGQGRRNASFLLLGAAVFVFFAGDMTWAVTSQLGYTPGPHVNALFSMIFLIGFSLFGVAALHPSIRDLTENADRRQTRLSAAMLAALAVASLIAPAILIVEVVHHDITDGIAIAVGSMVLFLLVMARMGQLLREVEQQALVLRRLSTTDELTGVLNRRAWHKEISAAMAVAERSGVPMALVMLDLDHFKRYNDEFGHQSGDQLLRNSCAAWLQQLRPGDALARYGGEEFVVILPGAAAEAASTVIGRLRAATPWGQTFSAGIAVFMGAESEDELVGRADRALYESKRSGRDRTSVASVVGSRSGLAPSRL